MSSRWAAPKRYKRPEWCKKEAPKNGFTAVEYKRIRLNAGRIPQAELARLMGRSVGFINNAIKRLNMEFGNQPAMLPPRKPVHSENAERMMRLSERIG